MKNAILNPQKAKKLNQWKKRFEEAKQSYQNNLTRMSENEGLYEGERTVNINPNKGQGKSNELSTNVRNITYELIESQVDSSIPMPKVTPIHEEDEELAQIIEHMLENEIRLLHFHELNDESERTTTIQGGDFFHVEWDNSKGFHCNMGGISVSLRHPRSVIPQPGVAKIEDMDYIFVMIPQTKDAVKRKYHVNVSDAADTELGLKANEKRDMNEDIVTMVKTYYRNSNGGIGLFSWVEEFVIEDCEDFQARRLMRCKECGQIKNGDVCVCGSKKFEEIEEPYEEIAEDIRTLNGTIKAFSSYESQSSGADGVPATITEIKQTKIPYYKPNVIPLVLRKNISRHGRFLGSSDAAVIEDQQDAIKKIGSKMQEKLLKGGSVVTLPKGMKIETTDRELKIVRVNTPAEAGLVGVKNIQADTSQDALMLERNYEWAKSVLGITNAYQGKYDSSATSGVAKQYSINQAAGRLESKRVIKNESYARLYEMIFKHMLAYADQPVPLSNKGTDGKLVYSHFNRYDFLKVDAAGEYYWDDEFIFETDPTSTILMNREAMWNQVDVKYQAGAFGPIGEDRTLYTYWTFMEKNDYPNASVMKKIFEERVQKAEEEQKQLATQQQFLMQAQGGGMNVLP